MREKPDVLLVLGGSEKYQRRRAYKASEMYEKYQVPVIVSGSHTIASEAGTGKKDCERIAELISGVPGKDIILEREARDTLGNMYFSRLLMAEEQRAVGLITDYFQMRRSLWLFRKVMPDKKPIPIYSSRDADAVELLTQEIRLYAIALDLMSIRAGDLKAIERFLRKRTSMGYENPKFSLTGLLVNLEKRIGFLQNTGRL
jgi:uncharacterized SAM-binding protein YcdF (DUF218 family)